MIGEITFSELSNFYSKQWAATEVADTHTFTLYGGSRGPGKSHWLRWYPIRFLLQCADQGLTHVRAGLFCENYPALKDRHLTKIADFPEWLGELKDSKADGLAFHLDSRYGGGVLALRNLDDPSKYKSSEFALIAVDELTANHERVFHTLRGSLRWPGLERPRFIAASNPDGRGAIWVRNYFLEKQLPDEMQGREKEFAFVPALPGDNPYLPQSYWDELNSLPEKLRRAWRDGDWYVTFEGLVYDNFSAENIEAKEPDPEKTIELAVDDGYVDARAILFVQRTGTEILVFDEIYHRRHLPQVCVQEVKDRCKENKWPMPEIAVGGSESVELREQFRMADIPYRGGTHKIIDGLQSVRRLIEDGNGRRVLKIHPRCKSLLAEVTQGYQYPEEGTRTKDEVPVDENNHAVDALRYWVWMRARR